MNRVVWAVKDAIWFRQTEWGRVYIHSWVFTLFNTFTSAFCTMSAFMVSSRQFFGDPIICDSGPVCRKEKKIKSCAKQSGDGNPKVANESKTEKFFLKGDIQ